MRALTQRNASLLPAGIVSVNGSFDVGDPVELVAQDGRVIGRGIVSFGADELPALMGRSTSEIAAEYGSDYERKSFTATIWSSSAADRYSRPQVGRTRRCS